MFLYDNNCPLITNTYLYWYLNIYLTIIQCYRYNVNVYIINKFIFTSEKSEVFFYKRMFSYYMIGIQYNHYTNNKLLIYCKERKYKVDILTNYIILHCTYNMNIDKDVDPICSSRVHQSSLLTSNCNKRFFLLLIYVVLWIA